MDKKALKNTVPGLQDFELEKLREIYIQTAQDSRLAIIEAEIDRRGGVGGPEDGRGWPTAHETQDPQLF